MSNEYDYITAKYYAAYRPSLHAPILSNCLGDEQFNAGLDVGCGTGRSTIALAKYCTSTTGIDPSKQMLDAAIVNSRIRYLKGNLEELCFDESSFDIITFAGVLFYAKSQKLLEEVIRVSSPGAKILVYDFEVLMESVHHILGVHPAENERKYDHEVNFSGLSNEYLTLIQNATRKSHLSISPLDLTYLVLSEKPLYEQLRIRWGANGVFKNVQDTLKNKSKGKNQSVEVNFFYSLYENKK